MAHWREAAGKLACSPPHVDLLITSSGRSTTEDLAASTGLCQVGSVNHASFCKGSEETS